MATEQDTGIWAQIERRTASVGGPRLFALVVLAQILGMAFFVVDARLCFALVIGLAAVIVVIERPLLGVGLLLGARLLSTGAIVFLRVGKVGVGPFEPALILCLLGLLAHAVSRRVPLWRDWPWQLPWLALAGWITASLYWSPDKGEGISDILPMAMVLANTLVILAFVKTVAHVRQMLWFWVGAALLICGLTLAVDLFGIQVTTVTFKAASGGGRETGLGQQPNWFAMNLLFIVPTAFGMAITESVRWRRYLLLFAGSLIFFMMLKSGSRGSAYATVLAAGLAAMGNATLRKWSLRFGLGTAAIFALGIGLNIGDSAKALMRIGSQVALNENYRQLNWLTCLQMFADTWGRGIGVGGYEELLPAYNNYLAQSLYDYPHGIFWEVIAHYGLPGLLLCAWLLYAVVAQSRELIRRTRGTPVEILAWTMPATLFGYFAWSFVEFTLNEKPFWEWLALHTALLLAVRAEQGPERAP